METRNEWSAWNIPEHLNGDLDNRMAEQVSKLGLTGSFAGQKKKDWMAFKGPVLCKNSLSQCFVTKTCVCPVSERTRNEERPSFSSFAFLNMRAKTHCSLRVLFVMSQRTSILLSCERQRPQKQICFLEISRVFWIIVSCKAVLLVSSVKKC